MKMLRFIGASAAIAIAVVPSAQAQQGTIDMSKAVCKELVASTPEEVNNATLTAIWFSGFFNGKHNRTVLHTETIKANADTVVQYCHDNQNMTIMKAVDLLIREKKLK